MGHTTLTAITSGATITTTAPNGTDLDKAGQVVEANSRGSRFYRVVRTNILTTRRPVWDATLPKYDRR